MHPALLIDEVFEVILEHCSDWDRKELRWTLAQLARTCKAWKDPSLDRLWRRLESAEPLLNLYDGLGCSINPTSQTTRNGPAYETRIRHITIKEPPSTSAGSIDIILPYLQSTSLLRGGCFAPASLIAAPTLRDVQVDLGPVVRTSAAEARCKGLATTFRHLIASSPALEKLRIRGWMSPSLSDTLPALRSLRSLVLSTGRSLSVETLASFTSLPHLQLLSVHANHIDAEDFTLALPPNASFASLQTLRIRASRPLICAILPIIPRCTLCSLHIESEELDQDPSAWKPTFDLLISRAADTLTDLTIDQILESEEMESLDSLPIRSTRFTLDTLRPLRPLTALQRFTIDAMILPDLTDKDIEQMASWWPRLQRFDLGTLSGSAEHDAQHPTPKITFASLRSLAKHCRNLRKLVLPLDLTATSEYKPSEAEEEKIPAQTALHSLLLGGLSAPDADMSSFIRQTLAIFPGLEEIECTSVDRSLHVDLSASAKDEADEDVVAMDGLANGQ